eukprot:461101-Amphidinium_carterae.2
MGKLMVVTRSTDGMKSKGCSSMGCLAKELEKLRSKLGQLQDILENCVEVDSDMKWQVSVSRLLREDE